MAPSSRWLRASSASSGPARRIAGSASAATWARSCSLPDLFGRRPNGCYPAKQHVVAQVSFTSPAPPSGGIARGGRVAANPPGGSAKETEKENERHERSAAAHT